MPSPYDDRSTFRRFLRLFLSALLVLTLTQEHRERNYDCIQFFLQLYHRMCKWTRRSKAEKRNRHMVDFGVGGFGRNRNDEAHIRLPHGRV